MSSDSGGIIPWNLYAWRLNFMIVSQGRGFPASFRSPLYRNSLNHIKILILRKGNYSLFYP